MPVRGKIELAESGEVFLNHAALLGCKISCVIAQSLHLLQRCLDPMPGDGSQQLRLLADIGRCASPLSVEKVAEGSLGVWRLNQDR